MNIQRNFLGIIITVEKIKRNTVQKFKSRQI